MVREPKSCGEDAWKRWLRNGARLFDRTWSGWALLVWIGSIGAVYLSHHVSHLAAVVLLTGLSGLLFGSHQAVFDVLASGKRGPAAWMRAIGQDFSSLKHEYLKSAVIRSIVALVALLALSFAVYGLAQLVIDDGAPKPAPEESSFLSSWSVWVWAWLIPAGWQKCGGFGWGHWLLRREKLPLDVAERLTTMGIALNAKSYSMTILMLMAPAIFLLMVFPPLLPVWDVFVAAVCWCIWDDVFGDGQGIKEMEKKRVPSTVSPVVGA